MSSGNARSHGSHLGDWVLGARGIWIWWRLEWSCSPGPPALVLLITLLSDRLTLSNHRLHSTDQRDEQKRQGILAAFCVFEGLSIGPLVGQSLYLDPSIVGKCTCPLADN